ncbi:MAG: hypothetical protein IH991_00455 [Planctomycetes bacterium]|nr:hypothetical protein [Planctomycetota bacterium]
MSNLAKIFRRKAKRFLRRRHFDLNKRGEVSGNVNIDSTNDEKRPVAEDRNQVADRVIGYH